MIRSFLSLHRVLLMRLEVNVVDASLIPRPF